MFTLFGLFSPASGPATPSPEAPRKRAFFGGVIEPAASPKAETVATTDHPKPSPDVVRQA